MTARINEVTNFGTSVGVGACLYDVVNVPDNMRSDCVSPQYTS